MYGKSYFVYILSDDFCGTLYVDITNDLQRRMSEHKNSIIEGFTKKYDIKKLMYYEAYQYVLDAIYREKQIKKWNRIWKIELIETTNPKWRDLSAGWF